MKCFKEKALLQKRYFDIGYGWTSYLKIVVAVFGIGAAATGNKTSAAIMLLFYGLFCYIFGWAYVKYGWYTIEIEITNKFNLFVREMRNKLKTKKFK